jgi:hypothetical protein
LFHRLLNKILIVLFIVSHIVRFPAKSYANRKNLLILSKLLKKIEIIAKFLRHLIYFSLKPNEFLVIWNAKKSDEYVAGGRIAIKDIAQKRKSEFLLINKEFESDLIILFKSLNLAGIRFSIEEYLTDFNIKSKPVLIDWLMWFGRAVKIKITSEIDEETKRTIAFLIPNLNLRFIEELPFVTIYKPFSSSR